MTADPLAAHAHGYTLVGDAHGIDHVGSLHQQSAAALLGVLLAVFAAEAV